MSQLDDIYAKIRRRPLLERVIEMRCIISDSWHANKEPRRSIPPQPWDEDLIVYATLEELEQRAPQFDQALSLLREALERLRSEGVDEPLQERIRGVL